MHSCILTGEELLFYGLNIEGRSPLNAIVALLFYPVIVPNKLYDYLPPPLSCPIKRVTLTKKGS